MRGEHVPCALCGRFVRKDEQQEAMGFDWCLGYGEYKHATAPPTVLFKPAPAGQVSERRAYLAQHQKTISRASADNESEVV